jgi:hypothetical protein
MIRIYANIFLLGIKRKLAKRFGLELVVRLEIGPSPNTAVNNMRQALSMRDLERVE